MRPEDIRRRVSLKWATRTFVVLTMLAVLIVLLYVNISPLGARVILKLTGEDESGKVTLGSFTKTAELGKLGEKMYQIPRLTMSTDEVTFELEVPFGGFKTMRADIRYRGNPREFELGVLRQPPAEYKYRPVHNRSLNELEWSSVSDEGVTLFQRSREYDSVSEFLDALPEVVNRQLATDNRPRVACYYYCEPVQPLDPNVNLDTAGDGTVIDYTLRGPHVFYFYTHDGSVRFSFKKQDLNDYKGADVLEMKLYDSRKELVSSFFVPDDGDISDLHRPSPVHEVDWRPPKLDRGYYKLELSCNHDVLVKGLKSSNRYLIAANSVFLADNYIYQVGPSKPATLFTDATVLTAVIWNPEAVQTVTVNDDLRMAMAEPMQEELITLLPGIKTVKTQTGGIILRAPDSYFSFAEGAFFNPVPLKTLVYSENQAMYDFVITEYEMPHEKNGWFEQTVHMNLDDVRPDGNKMRFKLRAPGLSQQKAEVLIDYLQVELDR